MKVLSPTIAAAALLGAAGCSNLNGGSIGDTFAMDSFLASDLGGSGFAGAVADEYQGLAAINANSDVNWLDSTVYRQKALTAAGGAVPDLFMPAEYGVNGELEALRGEVLAAVSDNGGSNTAACAEAYAMYDRLVEATYQDHGPGSRVGLDPTTVRAQFDAALTECVGMVGDMVVYFGFNRSDLTAAADAVIQDIASGVGMSDAVSVVGHTDTVGSFAYNQQLSERRATTVANRLVELGVGGGQIQTAGRSFSMPAVDTGPNVREPLNRRVEITVSP